MKKTAIYYKSVITDNFNIVLFVFFLVFFVTQIINDRFWLNDFKVYYSAAEMLVQGNEIYGQAYGLDSGFYKYSPFAAVLFVPFTLLPYYTACIFYFFIIAFITIGLFQITRRIVYRYFELNQTLTPAKDTLLLLLVFVISAVHIHRELHLGNTNMLLLFVFMVSLKFLLENKNVFAGVLLGIGFLFKPHFLILAPLLMFRNKNTALIIAFISVLAGFILPSAFAGWDANIEFHRQWLDAMLLHNAGLTTAEQTIYFLIYRILKFEPGNFLLLVLSGAAVIFVLYLSLHLYSEKTNNKNSTRGNRNFINEYILLLAVIPSLTLTDTEHFLLSIPVVMVLIMVYYKIIRKNIFALTILILALIMYGGNIRDLVGSRISGWLFNNGILGTGNLIIISIFMISDFISSKISSDESNPQLLVN